MRRVLMGLLLLVLGWVAFDFLAPGPAARIGIALEMARCGLSVKHAEIPGFDIVYAEGGPSDGEPLVLIHGFGAAKDNFMRVAAYLTPQYRVIIPDLPGFGDSSKPESVSYTIADQVARVHAFVETLGLKKVHLGGSSMGGFIITQYALTYPKETASLWLLGPAGTRKSFDSELRQLVAKEGRNPLISKTPADFEFTLNYTTSKHPWMPYSVKHMMAERAVSNYALHSRIFTEVGGERSPPLDERIQGLATPTLVVWGKEDRVLNPAAAETYKARMPDAQVILMDGIGHLPMAEAPKQTAQDYRAFRARLTATP